ncbi:hypothetical protein LCL97_06495 [Seohaeicola saemankumensis]|nr:hypothetical protein [Seohaeicola saemankumensis]MCA0870465.1 hypothetical protein [Seohaeicola saemankumensis]
MFKPQFRRVSGLAVGLAVVVLPASLAASACADRDTVISRLSADYSEQLTIGGLQKVRGGQSVMEIWASAETGTYTVLMTDARGVSCIVAAGTDFFQATPAKDAPGQAS